MSDTDSQHDQDEQAQLASSSTKDVRPEPQESDTKSDETIQTDADGTPVENPSG